MSWKLIPIVNKQSMYLYEKNNLAVLCRLFENKIEYSLLRDHDMKYQGVAVFCDGIVSKILKDWDNGIVYVQMKL